MMRRKVTVMSTDFQIALYMYTCISWEKEENICLSSRLLTLWLLENSAMCSAEKKATLRLEGT